ncbi:SIR2 family protein [Oceanicaulis alexandrii]|uniref:SIR2 family protein n=1 Tax=Oceanicaulis alexandrii TaxID=153233 RepID=UPI003BB09307
MSAYEATKEILAQKAGAPFLFLGSGFSRRYLGLEDWGGLLKRFAEQVGDYQYYLSTANGNLPRVAGLVSKDFHEHWWKSDDYAEQRSLDSDKVGNETAAIRLEIARYLSSLTLANSSDLDNANEIECLKEINVDGIITTNWDLLLESIFPEYKVYIGQEELLFSNPQGVAEIYKIHGCSTSPESLVLTEEDYSIFEENNPYLAAKLITIFIEHPIFIIGYSLSDEHIKNIIFSIARCLPPAKVSEFSDNLIFIQRVNDKESGKSQITFDKDGQNLIATVIRTDDFSEIYNAISESKRKIPARVLRYCKEQMYELVKGENPEDKISVVDIDSLESSEEVEFVVGVGVAQEKRDQIIETESGLAEHGYSGITKNDLFLDLLCDSDNKYDAEKVLKVALPIFSKTSAKFLPVYKYLNEVGIESYADLQASEYSAAKIILDDINNRGYQTRIYLNQFERLASGLSTSDLIADIRPEKAMLLIPFQRHDKIDLDALGDFLRQHIDFEAGEKATYFRKLAALYDKLKYGF